MRWMAPPAPGVSGAEEGAEGADSAVRFAALPPAPGTLLVFPAWLPHAVAPMRSRVEGAGTSEILQEHIISWTVVQ